MIKYYLSTYSSVLTSLRGLLNLYIYIDIVKVTLFRELLDIAIVEVPSL